MILMLQVVGWQFISMLIFGLILVYNIPPLWAPPPLLSSPITINESELNFSSLMQQRFQRRNDRKKSKTKDGSEAEATTAGGWVSVIYQLAKATTDTFTQCVRRKHISPLPVESYQCLLSVTESFPPQCNKTVSRVPRCPWLGYFSMFSSIIDVLTVRNGELGLQELLGYLSGYTAL